MVHKDAGELLTDGLGQHGRADTGIHAAGKCAQHFAGADLFPQRTHRLLHEGVHLPGPGAAADLVHKVVQDLGAVLGMQHFRVELHTVQPARGVLRRCHRAVGSVCHDLEAGGRRFDIVVMAHPADILRRQSVEQRAGRIQVHQRLAVFAFGGLGDLAAQHVHHELAAVADAQHRDAPGVNFGINGRRIRQIGAVGATGKDDPLGIFGFDLGEIRAVRIDLTVNITFTDAARDQLVILPAEVQYNDGFLLHGLLLSPVEYHQILLYYSIFTAAAQGKTAVLSRLP